MRTACPHTYHRQVLQPGTGFLRGSDCTDEIDVQLLGDAFTCIDLFIDLEKVATPVMAQVHALIIETDCTDPITTSEGFKEIPRKFDPKERFR